MYLQLFPYIVKYHYNVEFDEESFMYQRFITHLKYFVIRHLSGEDSSEKELTVVLNSSPIAPNQSLVIAAMSFAFFLLL